MLHGVLRLESNTSCSTEACTEYGLVRTNSRSQLENEAKYALERMVNCVICAKLQFNSKKSEAIALKDRLERTPMIIMSQGRVKVVKVSITVL